MTELEAELRALSARALRAAAEASERDPRRLASALEALRESRGKLERAATYATEGRPVLDDPQELARCWQGQLPSLELLFAPAPLACAEEAPKKRRRWTPAEEAMLRGLRAGRGSWRAVAEGFNAGKPAPLRRTQGALVDKAAALGKHSVLAVGQEVMGDDGGMGTWYRCAITAVGGCGPLYSCTYRLDGAKAVGQPRSRFREIVAADADLEFVGQNTRCYKCKRLENEGAYGTLLPCADCTLSLHAVCVADRSRCQCGAEHSYRPPPPPRLTPSEMIGIGSVRSCGTGDEIT